VTTKQDFIPEEWAELLQAPMTVTLYVTVSSPSVFGSVKEAYSTAKEIAHLTQSQHENQLLRELAVEFKDRETARKAQPDIESRDPALVMEGALAELEGVVRILNEKATQEESAEIRQWLYQIGVSAANAAKEGGFLGIGAVRVSPKEQAALDELQRVLGVAPAA
jgi:hypothetical protein